MSDLLAMCDWHDDELSIELPQWPEVVNVWVDGKAMPFVPVTDPDALGAIKCLQGLADATSVENEKLREERDHWHVEQVHAYGNWEDAHRRATELDAENTKLRELVRDMMLFFEDGDYCTICEKAAECESLDEYGHDCLMRGVYKARMRELGIEVEQ